ncbi:MAG TPA: S53 family peptidase [Mycobacteriales bacterium]|nr:S53 family peptidase [Mycobacteriales bacterium]
MAHRSRSALLAAGALAASVALLPAAPAGAGVTSTTAAAQTAVPRPPTRTTCQGTLGVDCLRPAQVRKAYGVGALAARGLNGEGVTIAIVDSFGSPTIEHDLRVFDRAFGLPDPPHFKVIAPAGVPPRYDNSEDRSGWAGETTLDVEWAHAMAPKANILLVVTPTSETEDVHGFPEIIKAERYVIQHHLADVISQSFGATEPTFTGGRKTVMKLRQSIYPLARKNRITVLASSGDNGATDYTRTMKSLFKHRVTSWPSTDPLVTSIGGTQLHLDKAGTRTEPDSAWGGPSASGAGGGGVSGYFTRPAFQDSVRGVVGRWRGTPDLSMSSAGQSPVLVYQSYDHDQVGWGVTWGTSEAAPLFAGIVALTVQAVGHRIGWINPELYRLAQQPDSGIVDVTAGTNDLHGSASFRGFDARPGYDLATGLGTIDASRFVPALAAAVRAR